MKNPQKTFYWIVDILKNRGIPFVVTGGLAAKSYGSPRELNDIDIDIHDKDFDLILEDVKPYIIFGPKRFKDKWWDLLLITLRHEGQDIDISGGDTLKICDTRTGEWKESFTNFLNVEQRETFGVRVPVASRKDLIEYKSMLAGEHQQVDIEAINKFIYN